MNTKRITSIEDLPLLTAGSTGEVWLLEAEPGPQRNATQMELVETLRGKALWASFLDMSFDKAGPWAGLQDLFGELLTEVRDRAPELIEQHAHELAIAVPAVADEIVVPWPTLTDLAPEDEKVRNYPADRAYRFVHGLVEFLLKAKELLGEKEPWVLACDLGRQCSFIGQRFLKTLTRRCLDKGPFVLVLGASRQQADLLERELTGPLERLTFKGEVQRFEFSLPEEGAIGVDAAQKAASEVERLLATVGQEPSSLALHGPPLVHSLRQTGREVESLKWASRVMAVFQSMGLYEDALEYSRPIWHALESGVLDDEIIKRKVFVKDFISLVSVGQPEDAERLFERSGILDEDLAPQQRADLYYLLAILYGRMMQPRDLTKAERFLDLGMVELQKARSTIPEPMFHFFTVFNRNGLALIRHFQKRFEEAIELCRDGYDRLAQHLVGDQHLLHRSVLLFNIGQVYSAMGDLDSALGYYSQAIKMDPNYSEYYNDRGSLYLRQGNFEAAQKDFLRAIECSPPYAEVWANLGQCYRRAGALPQALEAYDRALDLEPDAVLPRLGRAQILEAFERLPEALQDYDLALEFGGESWDALASRAILRYQLGEVKAALTDLDRAVELAPDQADLYHNRSVAQEELGYRDRAIADLNAYLKLAPDAPDRAEVEEKLESLQAAA